jgi:hypothetical protein
VELLGPADDAAVALVAPVEERRTDGVVADLRRRLDGHLRGNKTVFERALLRERKTGARS